MCFEQIDGKIIMRGFSNFSIEEILECGQCFRFERLAAGHYAIVALGEVLRIKQTADTVAFWHPDKPLEMGDFMSKWVPYFDLERDYAAIITHICDGDAVMASAAAFAPGIRILQQDPWEMLISFIISQNNRIPQIKKVIAAICAQFGDQIGHDGNAFPTPTQLARATEADLRALKAGFRAAYIMDATAKASAGHLPLTRDTAMPTADLRRALLEIKGIGEKVAHCILLFGYGRHDSFPVDTWVKKVMQQYYFGGGDIRSSEIQSFATAKFGGYSGFAQQYLFHYMRMQNGQSGENGR